MRCEKTDESFAANIYLAATVLRLARMSTDPRAKPTAAKAKPQTDPAAQTTRPSENPKRFSDGLCIVRSVYRSATRAFYMIPAV